MWTGVVAHSGFYMVFARFVLVYDVQSLKLTEAHVTRAWTQQQCRNISYLYGEL